MTDTDTFDPQGFMTYARTATHGSVTLEFTVPEQAHGDLAEVFGLVAALRRAVAAAQPGIEAAGGQDPPAVS